MKKEELAKIAHEMQWNCLEGKTFDYSILEKLTEQELDVLNDLAIAEHKKRMDKLNREIEALESELEESKRVREEFYFPFVMGEA